jgi:hypothetical protein
MRKREVERLRELLEKLREDWRKTHRVMYKRDYNAIATLLEDLDPDFLSGKYSREVKTTGGKKNG